LLGVYKVFPTRVKVKVNTITDAFIGDIKTFNVIQALKDLNLDIKFGQRRIQYVKLESASPNAVKAL
jgi:isochorismate hydrolase